MSFVKHPVLALVGLVALGLVGAKLWSGDLSVAQAGARVAVLTGVLVLAERLLLPLARSLVSAGQREP
jgi:hypothetical protein